jgi:repressor LexA
MREKLTPRQQEVFDFLKEFVNRRGYPPTIREIAGHFGMGGPRAVQKHLSSLERKGMIRRIPGNSRAIELAGMKRPDTVSVPLLGRIPAGPLDLAIEEREGEMEVDRALARGEGLFLLKVMGESMIGAHILDGDYALIRSQATAANGEIVAVRVGYTATLKRFYREGQTVRLQPENPFMEPIILQEEGDEEVAVIGKVLAVIRSYEESLP